MTEMTWERMKKIASDGSWESVYYRELENVIEALEDSGLLVPIQAKEHIFYAKNIFKTDFAVEFYFITKDVLTVFSYQVTGQEQSIINARTIPIHNCTVELSNYNRYSRDAICTLHLQEGNQISFAAADTNDHWKLAYHQAVVSIYKYLVS